MKVFVLFTSLIISSLVVAAPVKLDEYNWNLTDIQSKGFSRQSFFDQIDRNFVKVGSSICSNRALMWAYDFKRKHDVDSAKIFLFYTSRTGEIGNKTWWYHVAPMVNENGNLWVVDAGFPGSIRGPQTKEEWLQKFVGSTNCKAIKSADTDLIERMFWMQAYPERTSHGTFDCYYRIVPGTLWTPNSVAQNILGRDEDGRPVHYERHDFDRDELYQSCVEATAGRLGPVFGGTKEQCKSYANRYY